MTVQAITRTGGRRYGPTALAARAHRDAAPARDEDVRIVGRGYAGDPCTAVAPPRVDRTTRRVRRVGQDSTRPRSGMVDYARPPAAATCHQGSAAGPYRMGRWARLSMTLIVTAAIIVGALTVLLRPDSMSTRFVTVQPGDTLASIAQRDMSGWDPARAMAEIASLNHLERPAVRAGTVLRIPAGG